MSEPTADRTRRFRSGREAYRPGSGVRSVRRPARPAVALSRYTVTALVTASYVLPFDGHRAAGAPVLPVCGLSGVLPALSAPPVTCSTGPPSAPSPG
ncbi:hypothetical protein [Streptomyces sp. NPDC001348]